MNCVSENNSQIHFFYQILFFLIFISLFGPMDFVRICANIRSQEYSVFVNKNFSIPVIFAMVYLFESIREISISTLSPENTQ